MPIRLSWLASLYMGEILASNMGDVIQAVFLKIKKGGHYLDLVDYLIRKLWCSVLSLKINCFVVPHAI